MNAEKLERCIRYSLDRADSLRELKARENKYRNLFKGSKDAVFICDRDLVFTEYNHAASLLFGLDNSGLLNCSLFDFLNDEAQKEKLRDLLAKEENANDIEIHIRDQQEEIKPCLFLFPST